MICPSLAELSQHLDDRDPDVASHLDRCASCRRSLDDLRSVEVVLGGGDVWGDPGDHVDEDGLLELLRDEAGYDAHVLRCEPCQHDVAAVSESLLAFERGELPSVTRGLKDRLLRLAPAGASTVEEVAPFTPRVLEGGRSERKGSSRRQASGSQRRRSSRRAKTGVHRRPSGRRRALRTAEVARRSEAAGPLWAWSVLAAAACVLIVMAIAFSPSEDGGPGVAVAPTPSAPRGPLVSDPRDEPTPTKDRSVEEPRRGAEETTDWRPLYREPEPTGSAGGGSVREEPAREDAPVETPAEGTVGETQTRGGETPVEGEEPGVEPAERPVEPAGQRSIPDDGGRFELALGRLRGAVRWEDRDGNERLLRAGAGTLALGPGDRLTSQSGAFLSLDEGNFELCLDGELVVQAASRGPVLGLERGRVVAEVTKRPTGQQFVVATRQGDYAVLGTVFGVEVSEDASRVVVAEGLVEARNGLGTTRVVAGQGAVIASGEAPGEAAAADLGALRWAQALQPRREYLIRVPFDNRILHGFEGTLCEDRGFMERGRSLFLSPLTDNRYWGLVAAAPTERLRRFRAAEDVYVQFSVWSERDTRILLQTRNETRSKEYRREFTARAGVWETYTVPLMALTTYFDPGSHPVEVGDLFNNLQVYAGSPGDDFTVLLDDVAVFQKHY